jgi:hypothetical protein
VLAFVVLTGTAGAQSLSNFSVRLDMAPGGNYIVGFSVPGPTPAPVLLRAVGPSLLSLGVANPVSAPDMQVFDSTGKQVFFDYGSSVVLDSLSPRDAQADFLAGIFASVGAFPLTGGELLGFAVNYAMFQPGSYTAKIINDTGGGGTVLFEIYLLPGYPILWTSPPLWPLPNPVPVPPTDTQVTPAQ